ncbi:MAG TPA: type II secretion system F family protein [Xanthobacteraceae bacterium]|jgi:general secretion pathway protein F
MPSFRYRALTQSGDLVSGSIAAPTAAEVAHRIEFLGLVPIETVAEGAGAPAERFNFAFWSRPKPEDVTVFTRDLALLLRAGARINDGLELLAQDIDVGRLRPTLAKIRAAVLAGESFAEAIARHPALFPPAYVALVRVGEASGTLDQILEVIGAERVRAEALGRKLADALRYPAFVLCAAGGVLLFFLLFVLPQFATVLRDFNAKLDPVVVVFLGLSEFLRGHAQGVGTGIVTALLAGMLVMRRPGSRAALIRQVSRLPLVHPVLMFHRTALFCRNLGVLLGSGVALTTTLRILTDIMAATGDGTAWTKTVDRVRHGGKLSDALLDTAALPAMAIRMLRLGEETGQLPMLAGRVAEFYEAKLQRSLDRIVGVAGPAAIVAISIVVGGLIVSVMTALLSVSQIVE